MGNDLFYFFQFPCCEIKNFDPCMEVSNKIQVHKI